MKIIRSLMVLFPLLLGGTGALVLTSCSSVPKEPEEGWVAVFSGGRVAAEVNLKASIVKFYMEPEKSVIALIATIAENQAKMAQENAAKKSPKAAKAETK